MWPDSTICRCWSRWRSDRPVAGPRVRFHLSDTARVLISLYIPALVMSFGQGMVVPTIPALAATFGVSPGVAAQLITAGVLGRTVALIPVGMLLDRVGRKPALLGGPLIIAAASALTAIAPAFAIVLL